MIIAPKFLISTPYNCVWERKEQKIEMFSRWKELYFPSYLSITATANHQPTDAYVGACARFKRCTCLASCVFVDAPFWPLPSLISSCLVEIFRQICSMLLWRNWIINYCFPGGLGTFHALLNCIVHVIMYAYYGLSALGPAYEKFLWWKKHLTSIQLVGVAFKSPN